MMMMNTLLYAYIIREGKVKRVALRKRPLWRNAY